MGRSAHAARSSSSLSSLSMPRYLTQLPQYLVLMEDPQAMIGIRRSWDAIMTKSFQGSIDLPQRAAVLSCAAKYRRAVVLVLAPTNPRTQT